MDEQKTARMKFALQLLGEINQNKRVVNAPGTKPFIYITREEAIKLGLMEPSERWKKPYVNTFVLRRIAKGKTK